MRAPRHGPCTRPCVLCPPIHAAINPAVHASKQPSTLAGPGFPESCPRMEICGVETGHPTPPLGTESPNMSCHTASLVSATSFSFLLPVPPLRAVFLLLKHPGSPPTTTPCLLAALTALSSISTPEAGLWGRPADAWSFFLWLLHLEPHSHLSEDPSWALGCTWRVLS